MHDHIQRIDPGNLGEENISNQTIPYKFKHKNGHELTAHLGAHMES